MNEDQEMKPEAFEALLTRHGADPSLWPSGEREAALELLSVSEDAQELHAAMHLLDEALDEAKHAPQTAPDALLARVMADAADIAAEQMAEADRARPGLFTRLLDKLAGRFAPVLRPVAVCAMAAAFGLWIGQSSVVTDAAEGLVTDGNNAEELAAADSIDPLDGAVFAFLDVGGFEE